MFTRLIEKIECADISFAHWIAAFLGIVSVRIFLENFSSPAPSFPGAPDVITVIHYGLFYLLALLLISLIVGITTSDVLGILKFGIFFLPIIWLPPLIDLIWSHGAGAQMSYVFVSGKALWIQFLTLGGSSVVLGGITPGIKTEIVLIVCGIFSYVFIKKKNIAKAVVASLLSYTAIFFLLAFPGFCAVLGGPSGMASPQAFFLKSFANSHMGENFMRPTVQMSYGYAVGTLFNLGMASLYYLATFFLAALLLFICKPVVAQSFLRNIRPGRVLHFMAMIIVGALLAGRLGRVPVFSGSFDLVAFAVLLISFVCAWLFAVGVNDIVDVPTDRISNRRRPLVDGSLTPAEMQDGNIFFLAWSLLGGYLAGYWAFFAILVFIAAYYIYSAPPLRLKRVPFVSTFLISLACLASALAGFYFVDSGKLVSDFPFRVILSIVIFFTLSLGVKDMKDIAGDRAENVMTIPILFGKYGKEAVGILVVLACLSVPIILGMSVLFWPSLIAAVLGYVLVNVKNYREWPIFIVYFAYLATILFLASVS